jgi:hypothetical protein
LTTRVKCPDFDEYKKLGRVRKYLRGSKDKVLTLEADYLSVLKTWVDASFAVHHDLKSHTGAVTMLGKGGIITRSSKHKLNTRSCTEAELVGVYDALTQVLGTRYFLESQ